MTDEFDPFRDDFNVEEALSSAVCPPEIQPCSSFSEFEYSLAENEPEIFHALMKIEDGELQTLTSNAKVSGKLGSELSKRERLKRLQNICVNGATVMAPKPIKIVKRKVKHILSAEGRTFACATGEIFDCFERWITNCDRVNVKLRADAALQILQEPNRLLQGIIVAFDKHWNLIMRDVDEVYTPAVRLKKVQASPRAMPPLIVYSATQHGNHYIMQRNLKCSLITGSSVICVYLAHNESIRKT